MAGIGFFDYPAGCPTWVPHFSGIAKKPLGTPPWLLGNADQGFGPVPVLPGLADDCLKVFGRMVQQITDVLCCLCPIPVTPSVRCR